MASKHHAAHTTTSLEAHTDDLLPTSVRNDSTSAVREASTSLCPLLACGAKRRWWRAGGQRASVRLPVHLDFTCVFHPSPWPVPPSHHRSPRHVPPCLSLPIEDFIPHSSHPPAVITRQNDVSSKTTTKDTTT
ncbi:uncharacterized protein LOC123517763 [Portunus trituberculatus]|uniref:uncharacterized protein LOC123517763 n=1 Tax=Portunus trituberculatus TaxID=210409 RepID=UPI001E1CE45E|nr:uncharacterized protein LOC123517763 [Portunus trituberculatus]